MRRNKRSTGRNILIKDRLLVFLCLCLLAGSAVGALRANTVEGETLTSVDLFLKGADGFFLGGDMGAVFIKYGKYAVLLWICAFFGAGALFAPLILAFKGASYGFASAVLMRNAGKNGILLAMLSCVPQNLFLIPLYIALAYSSVNCALMLYKAHSPKYELKRESRRRRMEQALLLLFSFLLTMAASAAEIYVIPFFLKNIIAF